MILSRTSALAEPILSRESERKLIEAWQSASDRNALDRITRAYARVCYNIASYYTSNPEHLKELAQEGTFGIRRALDEYDFSYGTKFSTFSRRYIQNAIAEQVSTVASDISIPSRVFLDARAGRITHARNPSAFAAITPSMSFDAPLSATTGLSVAEVFPDSGPTPAEIVEKSSQENYFRLIISSALSTLEDRERLIMTRRHLIDPTDTLEEIGRDIGVTRERVRQLEAACIVKIHKYITRLHGSGANLFDK